MSNATGEDEDAAGESDDGMGGADESFQSDGQSFLRAPGDGSGGKDGKSFENTLYDANADNFRS
jgi:hypothetical protein